MNRLLTLAAAAALAACAGRAEEETGAAPARADTVGSDTAAATHVVNPDETGPPGVGGRPGNATITADSVAALSDTNINVQDEQTSDTLPLRDANPARQDTSTPGGPGQAPSDTTTMTDHDTTATQHETGEHDTSGSRH